VVHVWDRRSFWLADHLDRFTVGLARLRLDPGYDRGQIEAILHVCVRHAGLRQAYVSMTCTRGRLAAGSQDLRTERSTSTATRCRSYGSTTELADLAGRTAADARWLLINARRALRRAEARLVDEAQFAGGRYIKVARFHDAGVAARCFERALFRPRRHVRVL
jgi:branched-subunit amino acid aminotransferase/4-amino-4-deoxychorismate lyase